MAWWTFSRVREDRRVIYCLYVLGFLDLFFVSMGLPLLAHHARKLGATPSVIGLIGSIYGGIQFFSSPLIGKFGDVAGRRKALVITLLGTAVGYFLVGVTNTLVLLALSRIPVGIFKQTQGLCKASLADITAEWERPKVFGNANAIASLGFVVGPIIGGHLGMAENGFMKVMTLQSIGFVIMAMFSWLFINVKTPKTTRKEVEISSDKNRDIINKEESKEAPSTPDNTFLSKFWNFFSLDSIGSMVDILILRFVLGFAMILFRGNFTTMLEYRYQTTTKTNGYILSFNGMVSGFSGALVGYIMSFYNHNACKALLHFSVILTMSLFCITFSPDLWVLILFSIPLSFSTAVSRVCVTSLTLNRGRQDEKGVLLGVGSSLLSIARMLSPAIAGFALEYSVYGPGTISVVIASVGICIAAFPVRRKEREMKAKGL